MRSTDPLSLGSPRVRVRVRVGVRIRVSVRVKWSGIVRPPAHPGCSLGRRLLAIGEDGIPRWCHHILPVHVLAIGDAAE